MDIVYQVLYHYIHNAGTSERVAEKLPSLSISSLKGTIQRLFHFIERPLKRPSRYTLQLKVSKDRFENNKTTFASFYKKSFEERA